MSSFWDQRYDRADYLYGTEPNAFLRSQAWRLPPGGRALAIADGEGRNGVFLARLGLATTTVDSSGVAVAKARRLAAAQGVALDAVQADLTGWDWPVAAIDVAVSIFAHFPPPLRQQVHRRLVAALKPGGLLLLEAYRPDQIGRGTGGPPDPALTYTADLLRQDFAGLTLLDLTEGLSYLEEGPGHRGIGAIVRLVAAKA